MNNSMIEPSILSLLERVDNRYALVVVVSKRSRQLILDNKKLIDIDSNKPVTIAINEIYQHKIIYDKGNTSIK